MNKKIARSLLLLPILGVLSCGQAESPDKSEAETQAALSAQTEAHTNKPIRINEKHNEPVDKAVERTLKRMSKEEVEKMNTTPLTAKRYPSPPEPNYGPQNGSINFFDTDSSETIGGKITMKPAVDEAGNRVDETAAGITAYSIHWGLEVGEPGTQDDKGSGDLGGDCMGFRDPGHIVKMPASRDIDLLSWDIPEGLEVPKNAVYFVGLAHYGKIINLKKCTQIPIKNLIAD